MTPRRAVGLVLVVALFGGLIAGNASAGEVNGGVGGVVGGHEADSAKTKWFALVSQSSTYQCGGTVLNSYWLVTAAHCVTNPNGRPAHFVQVNPAAGRGSAVDADRVVVHPKYVPSDGGRLSPYDIALVHTAVPLGRGHLAFNHGGDMPALNQPLKVYGFGAPPGSSTTDLQVAGVRDLAGLSGSCGRYTNFNATTQICAGETNGGVDTCSGDSGGPLTASIHGAQVLVGIVSQGSCSVGAGYPGIYTRVSVFTPWIETVMSGNSGPSGATPKPTATPTARPTATPTARPTATPTARPTATPRPTATSTATAAATPSPTPTRP